MLLSFSFFSVLIASYPLSLLSCQPCEYTFIQDRQLRYCRVSSVEELLIVAIAFKSNIYKLAPSATWTQRCKICYSMIATYYELESIRLH